ATIRVGTSREREKFIEAGFPAARVFCVPVAVDVDAFDAPVKRDFRAELLGGGFRRLVASAGRMVYQKDFPTLLQAAAFLPKHVRKHFGPAQTEAGLLEMWRRTAK